MSIRYRSILLLLAILLVTWWAYAPGLHGGFLFDDFGSLPALGAYGPVTNWTSFWRYITSGTADPTGRPLALLSFLIDAHNWPADPFSFKRTNLILHLFNGALLFLLFCCLGNVLNKDVRRVQLAAAFATALWLFHPLMVSTTLYVVQREAMLAGTCTLIGLLLWLHGRQQLVEGRLHAGVTWSLIGIGGLTLLGTMAKANGVLLPLYALLLDIIALRPHRPLPVGAASRTHQIVMLLGIIPVVAVLGYVVWTGVHGVWVGGPIGVRPWSIGQRLLTEPRVLIEYLRLLWLPRPFSSGLFNDQYVASTSWLHPAATLPALLAVLTLIGAAWWQRRRHPALALAVLFFFVGQLLESTSIPLELYFEHRNYTPALFMFWPLSLWLVDAHHLRWAKIALMVALPFTLAGMTRTRAMVWGDVQTQALIWARINPGSPRAQANAAEIEMHHGHAQTVARTLEILLAAQPDQAQLAFNLIQARCMTGSVAPEDVEATRKAMLRTANTGTLFVRWFDRMLPLAITGSCRGLTPSALLTLINAGLKNPKLAASGLQQDMIYMRGRVALAQYNADAALADFVRALDLSPRPSMALKAAATLGQNGYPERGLDLLNHYLQKPRKAKPMNLNMATIHNWVLARQRYWPQEMCYLQDQLRLDAEAASRKKIRPSSHSSTTL